MPWRNFSRDDLASWVACHHRSCGYRARHHAAGSYDRPIAHADASQHKSPGANKRISSDADRRGLQGSMGQAEIVGAGAEIGLLCNTSILENFNLAEAVGVRAIAEAGPVVQGEVPGMLDARALMHEWPAVDGGAEAAQDEQPPGIECFGGPAT